MLIFFIKLRKYGVQLCINQSSNVYIKYNIKQGDDNMRTDHKSAKERTFQEVKNYFMSICKNEEIEVEIFKCIKKKELLKLFEDQHIQKSLFIYALQALYHSSNYDELENNIVMMNKFFDYQSYKDVKQILFDKLMKKDISVDEYCVIRHLIPFSKGNFENIVNILYSQYGTDALECAKICLIEDEYHLAYHYLMTLDSCENQVVLDLLCSYSMMDYLSLMRHYAKKQKRKVQFVPAQ